MTRSSIRAALAAGAAALLIGGMAVSPAWAYFTDSHGTRGGIRVAVEPRTDIEEDFDEKGKHAYIRNTSRDVPVFVRARVYTNAAEYLGPVSGDGWTSAPDAEGWYYYGEVLDPYDPEDPAADPARSITRPLDVVVRFQTRETTRIIDADGTVSEFTNTVHTGENFNVIVVYEAVPIQFDDGGALLDPQACDWALAFDHQEEWGE